MTDPVYGAIQIEKLQERITELEKEVERWKENVGDLETLLSEFRDGTEYKRATDEIQRLRAALQDLDKKAKCLESYIVIKTDCPTQSDEYIRGYNQSARDIRQHIREALKEKEGAMTAEEVERRAKMTFDDMKNRSDVALLVLTEAIKEAVLAAQKDLEPWLRHQDDCKMTRANMAYRHPKNCTCGLARKMKEMGG